MALCFRDNDAAGLKYSRDLTRRLHARHVHVDWIDVAALGLPDGGDVIDWLAMQPEATWADVLQLPRLVAPDMGEASQARTAALAAREPARPARREPAHPQDVHRGADRHTG